VGGKRIPKRKVGQDAPPLVDASNRYRDLLKQALKAFFLML
jgi:hypothetical protein